MLQQAYRGESWTGTYSQGYPGVLHATSVRFPASLAPKVRVLVILAQSVNVVPQAKKAMRAITGWRETEQNVAVHTTDNHGEVLVLCKVLPNPNFSPYPNPTPTYHRRL